MTDRDKREARLVQDRTGITYAAALDAVRSFHAVPATQRVPWLMGPTEAAGHIVDDNGRQVLAYQCGKQPEPTRVRLSRWEGGGYREEAPTRGCGHTRPFHELRLHESPVSPRQRWTPATLLRESITLIEGALDGETYDPADRATLALDLAECRRILGDGRPVLHGVAVPANDAELTAAKRVVEDACAYWRANDYEATSPPGSLDEWLGWSANSGANGIFCYSVREWTYYELPSSRPEKVNA